MILKMQEDRIYKPNEMFIEINPLEKQHFQTLKWLKEFLSTKPEMHEIL